LVIGMSAASALTVPTNSPRWFTGNEETIRSGGSDTTFFMQQKLADLFMQSGLYGCTQNGAAVPNYSTCLPGSDAPTTDTVDNYDHIEVMTGLGKIGSGDGQKILCGVESAAFPVDFARSSKPASSANGCNTMIGLGYAKDGVPMVDLQTAEGPGTAAGATFGSQVVGPVAAGWEPGDPITCDQNNPPGLNGNNGQNGCSGVPFTNIDNTAGTASVAWRLYCSTDTTSGAPDQKITDWGMLTNLHPTAASPNGTVAVGDGTPINVPVEIIGVNTGSGTEFTFAHYVDSGQTSGGSDICTTTNTNQTPLQTYVALENNAAQIHDFAVAPSYGGDSGATLTADQDAFAQASLYYMANGVYQTSPYSKTVTVNGFSWPEIKMTENGIGAGSTQLLNNSYPTARTLYNIYRTDTVRASTASYLDWQCDSNHLFTKGLDLSTGKNYDAEITTTIQNTYGFIRLNDQTAAPNNSCQMITVAPSVSDGVTTLNSPDVSSATGFEQAGQTPVVVGDLVTGAGIPANTYVSQVTDANDLVLTNNATVGATGVTFTFNIHSPNN
jgi:hypothetical protein